MLLPNRHESTNTYRYGYQGSEKDDEIKGEGNSYTTTYRQLDPRIGRWLSIDPKANIQAWSSPYVSMNDNPILFNDIHGDIAPLIIYGLGAVIAYFAGESINASEKAYTARANGNMAEYNRLMSYSGKMNIGAFSTLGFVISAEVIAAYGIKAVTAYLVEEGVEYAIEEATGLPIILDPLDVVERGFKEAAKKQLNDAVAGVLSFRSSLSRASKNIKPDKWKHIIEGSRGNNHNWEALVDNPMGSKDKIQDIISGVADNGKIISKGNGAGEIVQKVDGNWVTVQYGTNPETGAKVINDAWIETRPEKIEIYTEQ